MQTSKEIGVTKTLETPIRELEIGSVFAERYEVLEDLGSGGMVRFHPWVIGEALGFRGLMRAAKEKRKGYLLFRCSVYAIHSDTILE